MIGRLLAELARQRAQMRWDAGRIRRHHDLWVPRAARDAFDSTAAYRARFEAAGVRPEAIRRAADLPLLPHFPRAEYRRLPESDRLRRGLDAARCLTFRTSGTSGIPLNVIATRRESAIRHAAWYLAQRAVGMPVLARRLVVGMARPHRFSAVMNRVRRQCGVEEAVEEIRRFRPAVLTAYPGQFERLLERYARAGERPPPVRMLYAGGEMLDADLGRRLEEFFRAPVADIYGTWEIGIAGLPCPEGGFHPFSPWLIFECARDGRPLPKDEEGDLLVTDLRERAMPLVRYAIGDRAVFPSDPCPCRTGYPRFILRDARRDDPLHTLDGRRVAAMPLVHYLSDEPAIRRYRITERAVGDILFELELDAPLPTAAKDAAEAAFRRELGEGLRMAWSELPAIPPLPSGKYRRIVSRVGAEPPSGGA